MAAIPTKVTNVNLQNKSYRSTYNPNDGSVKITAPQTRGSSTPAVLYENGTLTQAFIDNPDLYDSANKRPTATGKSLIDQGTREAVQLNSSDPNKYKLNQTVKTTNQSQTYNTPGQSTTSPPASNQNVNSIFSVLDPPKTEDYGTRVEQLRKLYGSAPLKYPINLLNESQDVLLITQYTYKSPYTEIFEGGLRKEIFQKGAQRTSALKEKIADLYLPIPNSVADSNGVDWGTGNHMNTTTMAAAGDIPGVLGTLAASAGANMAADALKKIGFDNPLTSTLDLIGRNPDIIYAILSQQILNPGFLKNLQALLLRSVGFNITGPELLSRGYGVVTNTNLELLFTGPSLRSFDFGYTFTPRSKSEAAMCRKIIRYFKQGMAPKKKYSNGGYGAASYLLATPNVFKLRYRTIGKDGKPKDIAGLNKFKICALTNMSTSYSDGMWAAFEEGQPIKMQINLSFKELEPIYESDYQSTISKEFSDALAETKNNANLDQDPVADDEIGY